MKWALMSMNPPTEDAEFKSSRYKAPNAKQVAHVQRGQSRQQKKTTPNGAGLRLIAINGMLFAVLKR
jgi:hypothetical protein